MGTLRITIPLLVLITGVELGATQPMDARGLLRGAEVARKAVKTLQCDFTLTETDFGAASPTPHITTVSAIVDGVRRTFRQDSEMVIVTNLSKEQLDAISKNPQEAIRLGLGQKETVKSAVAFDGHKLCRHVANSPAHYMNIKDCSDIIAHPRVWGLIPTFNVEVDSRFYLDPPAGTNIRVFGMENIDGNSVWHVGFDREGASYEYWVDDREPFRIHRARYPFGQSKTLIDCAFENLPNDCPIPSRVRIQKYAGDKLKRESVLSVAEMRLNPDVGVGVGEIGSLRLPSGTRVVDKRVHKNLGIWSGSAIVADTSEHRRLFPRPEPAIPVAVASSFARGRTIAIVLGLALLVIVSLVLKRTWARRAANLDRP